MGNKPVEKQPDIIQDKTPTKSARSSNLEMLRIVCLLIIIAGHMIMWHHFNSEYTERIVRCGVRPFFSVAANCFVLISGWFGIGLKFKKILSLHTTLVFWTFLICGICIVAGFHKFQYQDIHMLIPLITRQYWFITAYVALCLISPFLNITVKAMMREEFKKLLVTCICLFVLLPTLGAILLFGTLTSDAGYGIVNFVVLYMLGRYMRLYAQPQKSFLHYFLYYVALMVACGLTQILLSNLLDFEFTRLLYYDTFFMFFGSVALFCAFSRLSFHNGYINLLATACFGAYILHIHPWTGQWLFESFIGLDGMSDVWFLLMIPVIPIIVYLCCFLLEETRILIFKMTGGAISRIRHLIR